jgi:PmbA protein
MSGDSQDSMTFAQDVVGRLAAAGSDEAQVMVERTTLFEVEFDNQGVQLVRDNLDERTVLTVFEGQRKGQAALNGRKTEDVSLAQDIALSGASAGEADPANTLPKGDGHISSELGQADADRDRMAAAVEEFLAGLAADWPLIQLAPSHYCFNRTERSFANSAGATGQEQRGYYSFEAMFSGRDGDDTTSFNYTSGAAFDPFGRLLDAGGLARLFEETTHSFSAKPIPEKFVGDLVMTPAATGELFGSFLQALGGLTLLGGLSPYADKEGQVIASDALTITNMPTDPGMPLGAAFDDYGLPSESLNIVDQGVLKNFLIDHYSSLKLDRPYTAGDVCPVIVPGDAGIDEIIASTERGVLLGRFSGGRPNVQLDISGVAKNSFYIEDGKIQYPLVETMISCNLQDLLRNIAGISSEAVDYGGSRYPFISASGVTILTG